MKTNYLGITLLILGVLGRMVLIILSTENLVNYNGIQGYEGFLLMYGVKKFDIFFTRLITSGLLLCLFTMLKGYIQIFVRRIIHKVRQDIKD